MVMSMTVLDVDPPRPRLQLVDPSGTPNSKASANSPGAGTIRDHRYRSGVTLYGDARRLYRAVLEHALASGEAINPDALRVVLAVKQAAASAGPIARFTGSGIWQLMFVDVAGWCRARHLDIPAGCDKALWGTVCFLDRTAGFAPASDDLDELLEAIEDCTGGSLHRTESGTSNRPPSTRGATGSLRSRRGPKRS